MNSLISNEQAADIQRKAEAFATGDRKIMNAELDGKNYDAYMTYMNHSMELRTRLASPTVTKADAFKAFAKTDSGRSIVH